MRYILFCLIFPVILCGQINELNKLPEMMPTSPKTFEFLKYTEVPVSKYTGVPNVSIPLFNIEAKGLSIPITLNYHSNGFKVEEESGCTGLGWTISTNWNIVQVVNGFDDFGPMLRNRSMPDFANIIDVECSMPVNGLSNGSCYATGNSIVSNCDEFLLGLCGAPLNANTNEQNTAYLFGDQDYVNGLVLGQKDFQPDIFMFNLPGYSGKFVLDWANNNYVCLTDNKIKITPTNYNGFDAPMNFCILVPDGHVFTFTIKEKTEIIQNFTQNENSPSGTSSIAPDIAGTITSRVYELTQIVTNKAETLSFEYLTTNAIKNFPSVTKSKVHYEVTEGYYQFPSGMTNLSASFSYTKQPYSYLSKISFNNGILLFNYSDRIDLIGSKKLDNVELKRTLNGNTVKKINFSYDYFIGHSLGTNTDSYLIRNTLVTKEPQELTHRLKLMSVCELGSNPYLFEYDSEQLPKKTSLAKDYWGYYNGFLSNNSSFVDIYKFNIAREKAYFFEDKDNINCSILQHSKASVLNKITYPTGGFSIFNYELNSFDNVQIPDLNQGIKKSFTISTPTNQLREESTKVLLIEGGATIFKGSCLLSTRGCQASDGEICNKTYFKIKHFNKNLISYIKDNPSLNNHYMDYGLHYVLAVDLDFLDENPNNQTLYNQFYDFEESPIIRKSCNSNQLEEIHNDLMYILSEGIAVFDVHGGCGIYNGTENSSLASATLTYNDYKPLTNLINYGAGIRIKDITTYSKQDKIAFKKSYIYQGGKLMSPPKYYNTVHIPNYTWEGSGDPLTGSIYTSRGDKTTLYSNNFTAPSSNALGKYVGYDLVDEYSENFETTTPPVENNGKIREYYMNNTDVGGSGGGFYSELRTPRLQYNPDNGLVTKQEIYNNDNFLLKEITNLYNFQNLNCVHGMKIVFRQSKYYETNYNMFGIYANYTVAAYPIKACYTSLKKRIEKNYFSSSSSLSSTQDFSYNDYNQNNYIKTTNGSNEIIETYNSYPKDFSNNSANSTAVQMANKNILSPLISRQVKKNDDIISKEEFEYFYKSGSNNPAIPDIFVLNKYKFAKGSQVLENSINYNSYDSYNNLTEFSKESTHVSYIWGYNGVYPIAKIENANHSEIASRVEHLKDLSNADIDIASEQALREALNALRTDFPNAMIITYTYDPLVGVTSITDPKGYTTYYNYDLMGRLVNIKDADGNILSENEYHYKN